MLINKAIYRNAQNNLYSCAYRRVYALLTPIDDPVPCQGRSRSKRQREEGGHHGRFPCDHAQGGSQDLSLVQVRSITACTAAHRVWPKRATDTRPHHVHVNAFVACIRSLTNKAGRRAWPLVTLYPAENGAGRRLENGLRAVVIQDKDIAMAAACANVQVCTRTYGHHARRRQTTDQHAGCRPSAAARPCLRPTARAPPPQSLRPPHAYKGLQTSPITRQRPAGGLL